MSEVAAQSVAADGGDGGQRIQDNSLDSRMFPLGRAPSVASIRSGVGPRPRTCSNPSIASSGYRRLPVSSYGRTRWTCCWS